LPIKNFNNVIIYFSAKEGRKLADTKVKSEGILVKKKVIKLKRIFHRLPNSQLGIFYVPYGYRQNTAEASYTLPLPSAPV